MDAVPEFVEGERPVVKGGGQAEPVFHEALLPRPVPRVHGAHLGQRDVALVDEHDEIIGEIVQQGHGRGPRGAPRNDPAVILDPRTVSQFLHHLHVVRGPLMYALGFQQFLLAFEPGDALLHLPSDLSDGPFHFLRRRYIMAGGIDGNVGNAVHGMPGDGVDLADPVDLVSEKLDPDGFPVGIGGVDLHRVAPDTELVPLKCEIVPLVTDLHQFLQQLVPVSRLPDPERDHHVRIVDGVSQSVNAADGRYHDHVPALEQARRRAVAQTFDLVVDGTVLLDVRVRMGDIRLRLIVIIVADEILHGVVREKLLELGTQLGRQRLVVRQHQRRPLQFFDNLGHRVGLSAPGDPQQRLLLQAQGEPLGNGGDRLRLVSGRFVFALHSELRHSGPPSVSFFPLRHASRSPAGCFFPWEDCRRLFPVQARSSFSGKSRGRRNCPV